MTQTGETGWLTDSVDALCRCFLRDTDELTGPIAISSISLHLGVSWRQVDM